MKTRTGFVSNSSSQSFCIYGTYINNSDANNLGKPENQDLMDWAESLETTLSLNYPPYSDGFYIGKNWDSIGDNETGNQFKLSVQKELQKLFGKPLKCNSLSEAWYNG